MEEGEDCGGLMMTVAKEGEAGAAVAERERERERAQGTRCG